MTSLSLPNSVTLETALPTGPMPSLVQHIAGQNPFSQLPKELLNTSVNNHQFEIINRNRDSLLPAQSKFLYFVVRGQVSLALFEKRALLTLAEQANAQSNLTLQNLHAAPHKPVVRLARKNIALFKEGEFFNPDVLGKMSIRGFAFFTLTPVTLLRVHQDTLAHYSQLYSVFGQQVRYILDQSEQRLSSIQGVEQDLFDFYMRQGMSIAGKSIRVRRIDRCIDCNQCEEACETRHGSKRLHLRGYQLGLLDFVYTCRSCIDRRCIPPCEHDAIHFDTKTGEIQIDTANCIGCSMCAQSCPYHAIDMLNIAEPSEPNFSFSLKNMLEAKGHLRFGPGTTRIAALRQVASKCDHCSGFSEQACIDACPTGALMEVSTQALFHREITKKGEQPLAKSARFSMQAFAGNALESNRDVSRVTYFNFSKFIWTLGLLLWASFMLEACLRVWKPSLSGLYTILLHDGMEPSLALLNVSYLPGSGLALLSGYLGTALIVFSAVYPLQKRIPRLKSTISNQYWLDLHLMTGSVGPLFVLLHTAMRFDNWVSVALASMIIVIVAGGIGRYLYPWIHAMAKRNQLEILHHKHAIRQELQTLPELQSWLLGVAEQELLEIGRAQQAISFWTTLPAWIRQTLRTMKTKKSVRKTISTQIEASKAKKITSRLGRILRLETRYLYLPRISTLPKAWKWVHIFFAIVFLLTTIVHIYVAIRFSL